MKKQIEKANGGISSASYFGIATALPKIAILSQAQAILSAPISHPSIFSPCPLINLARSHAQTADVEGRTESFIVSKSLSNAGDRPAAVPCRSTPYHA